MNSPSRGLFSLSMAMTFVFLPLSVGRASGESPCSGCKECVQHAVSEIQARGWLGVTLHYHDAAGEETPPRMDIQQVHADGPAEKAGLKTGDSILSLDGTRVATLGPEELTRRIRNVRPGDRVSVEIDRNGESFETSLTARRMPFTALATALGAKLLREMEPRMDHRLSRTPSRSGSRDR